MSPAGTRFAAGLGMNWSTDDWRKARADRMPRRARARASQRVGLERTADLWQTFTDQNT
jgi:hypothetical protein